MAKKRDRKRETVKGPTGLQDEINRQIRRDIRQGVYSPGSRLPSRADLQQRYHTTPVTIQRAFDKMAEDGFVRSEGQRGTFVADHPPCLFNYAVVFPLHFNDSNPEINFWRALVLETKRRSRKSDYTFTIYTGLNGHIDEPDYLRLREDVDANRFAGVIFASSPHLFCKTPLFRDIIANKELARVAFMTQASFPEIPAVSSRDTDSLHRVFDFLQNSGAQRLAIITAISRSGYSGKIPHEDVVLAEAASRGIDIKPYHIQVMHTSLAPRARQLAQLLLRGPGSVRPDAILIMDDSLVEAVTKGVVDAGLSPPCDLVVAGMCNFPEMPPSSVPIARYGMNVSVFLETCLRIMDDQRHGKDVSPVTVIPSEFRERNKYDSETIT